MSERTLADPLSGEEIIQAVLDKIEQSLRRDCYLHPSSAYDFFSAKVTLSISAFDIGTEFKVEQTVVSEKGEAKEEASEAEVEIEIPQMAPNEVREQSGLPIPTLTKDESGKPVIRGVKYQRKGRQKAS
jgi:hypothetical protein